MLLRFDPFRELDRLSDETGRRSSTRSLPMDAHRDDETVVLRFDVPGASVDDIDLSVEQDTLTLTVERTTDDVGDAMVRERPTGRFSRRLRLGDTLDTERLEADHANGVLTVRIPLREKMVARKVAIGTGDAIETTTSGTA